MNKTIAVMHNCTEVLHTLRCRYYGENATAKEYKDSYIVNKAISEYNASPTELMDTAITKIEESAPKITKSINFRIDVWGKLATIAGILQITPMEVCRRILLYTITNNDIINNGDTGSIKDSEELFILKSKLALLDVQLSACIATHNEIMDIMQSFDNVDEYKELGYKAREDILYEMFNTDDPDELEYFIDTYDNDLR